MSQRREQTGHELRRLLGPLRRAVTRAIPAEPGVVALTEAQAELLRTVGRAGPLSTTALAARLHLARPTVSNLVTTLTQAGLLTREPSTTDLRAVLIDVTPLARQRLAAKDRCRDAVLQHALDGLGTTDRAAIETALPALARLLDRLHADATPETTSDGDPPVGRSSPARPDRTGPTHPSTTPSATPSSEGQHL